ncbi:Ldl recept a domain containing protein [Asbolus verrucosus]|uniref:Ldl recept a domain containing protein n=1 Tax=Asbolus verrucosus TaxID=1661398 RepID=A0A482VN70_ASBVE|nr:Ldl recept a domain containing protein [Asbolus verrucosus]
MQIVKTVQMKIQVYAINRNVIQQRNLHAKMVVAFQNYGCAILTMIAETILTNRLICVDKRIVQRGGEDVPGEIITGAFQNGSSAMVKMTAVIDPMNFQKTAQSAIQIRTLNVKITAAFLINGSAISLTTAAMVPTKRKIYVRAATENAQNQNINAIMENASHHVGGVTTKTIVAIILTKTAVENSNVKMVPSNVLLDTVSHRISVAMEIAIAVICPTRKIVRQDILEEDIVQNRDSSADLCDGADDCGDESDEAPSLCSNFNCDTLKRFQCGNHRCIPRYQLCDGIDNCGDGSDENNMTLCATKIKPCNAITEYKCANKKCINRGQVCDFADDCGDSSDELGCHHNNVCTEANRGGCEHHCLNLTEVKEELTLLFANGPEIRSYKLKDKEETNVISEEKRIEAIDYNPETQMIFWADSYDKTIKRSYMVNAVQGQVKVGYAQDLSMKGNSKPTAVAVDWVGDNLYWTETDRAGSKPKGKVMVAKTDGRYRRALVNVGLESPTSIVVDPQLGRMFWSDAGTAPKIEVSWMDGSKRRPLIIEGIRQPTGLAIDYAMDHALYWVDTKLNNIESIKYDGSNRKTILRDVFESDLYWITKDTGELVKQDKFGRGVPFIMSYVTTLQSTIHVGATIVHISVYWFRVVTDVHVQTRQFHLIGPKEK